jgi:hypothetical protein
MSPEYLTVPEIRERLREAIGTGKGAVVAFARANNLPKQTLPSMRTGHRPPSARVCEVLGVRILDNVELMRRQWVEGARMDEIAAKFGCSHQNVSKLARKHGWPARTRANHRHGSARAADQPCQT